jgi:hypothetical protein
MRISIAIAGSLAALGFVALIVDRAGATLGTPPAPALSRLTHDRPEMTLGRVRALLAAARGTNVVACQLAAATVDGHSWSSSDRDFHPGDASDSIAGNVARAVHSDVEPAALPVLREALSDTDWCVRRLAAPLLGRVHDPAAVQAMVASLASSDAVTREMAAMALGFAEDAGTIPQLVAKLKDDAPRVRATAAWALGEIDHKDAARPLIGALGDADPLVRESVVRALGEVEDTSAIAPLTDVLETDRVAAVRRAAAWALGEIIS